MIGQVCIFLNELEAFRLRLKLKLNFANFRISKELLKNLKIFSKAKYLLLCKFHPVNHPGGRGIDNFSSFKLANNRMI